MDLLSSEVTIQLSDRQRVAAMQLSSQPGGNYDDIVDGGSGNTFGGDGTPILIDFNSSALKD